MKTFFVLTFSLGLSAACFSQSSSYSDSLKVFRDDYIKNHEIVKDKSHLKFFNIDNSYRVVCRFEKTENAKWFAMSTSSGAKDIHRKYGTLHFTIHDTALTLTVYQSQSLLNTQQYKDYLFVPFTDATNGEETYAGGRYIDMVMGDIKDNQCIVDFNKAYNPYCAYTDGYSCPIPPMENHLLISIRAGEKASDLRKH